MAGLAFTIIFVGIWPGSMLTVPVLDSQGFLAWTTLSRGWAYVAATFIIIVPLVQEVNIAFQIFLMYNEIIRRCLGQYIEPLYP